MGRSGERLEEKGRLYRSDEEDVSYVYELSTLDRYDKTSSSWRHTIHVTVYRIVPPSKWLKKILKSKRYYVTASAVIRDNRSLDDWVLEAHKLGQDMIKGLNSQLEEIQGLEDRLKDPEKYGFIAKLQRMG